MSQKLQWQKPHIPTHFVPTQIIIVVP